MRSWKLEKKKKFLCFCRETICPVPGCGKFGKEFEECASEEHETTTIGLITFIHHSEIEDGVKLRPF